MALRIQFGFFHIWRSIFRNGTSKQQIKDDSFKTCISDVAARHSFLYLVHSHASCLSTQFCGRAHSMRDSFLIRNMMTACFPLNRIYYISISMAFKLLQLSRPIKNIITERPTDRPTEHTIKKKKKEKLKMKRKS